MARQSPEQKRVVERVMHEFKDGELEQRNGAPVKNPRQAIAIALHEAGASNQETPKRNRATLRKTKARETQGRTAGRRPAPARRGRSSMPRPGAATSPAAPR